MRGIEYTLHFSLGLQFGSALVSEIVRLVRYFRPFVFVLGATGLCPPLNPAISLLVLEALVI